MKLSPIFKARNRLARWGMDQGRAFAALIAPWIAMPGDRPMSLFALIVIVLVFVIGLVTIGAGGVLAIRELLPIPRHEVQP